MQKRGLYLIGILIVISTTLTLWCFDIFNNPVEPVGKLIGKDYAFALEYFDTKPSSSTSFNITDELNEFQGGVLSVDITLKDSIINQHTWDFSSYRITIWTGVTDNSASEIIDAIRYKNGVEF